MFKQVFIINKDLKMGKGKIAVQVAHGEVYYMDYIMRILFDETISPDTSESEKNMLINYKSWCKDGLMKKVVLKATEKELHYQSKILSENSIWNHEIYDKGLTQIPENSFTCLVVEPLDEKLCDWYFSHLKLL